MTTRKQKIVLYTFDCTGCGYCVKVCGNEVLKLVDNGACRFVNVADASRCNGCGRCERRCPNGAISLKQPDIMKEKLKTAGFCLGGTALLALGVAVTMWLWNALIPEIVGWTSINYWQALGLLLLIRLLFGTSAPSGGPGVRAWSRRGAPPPARSDARHVAQRKTGVHPAADARFMRTGNRSG